MPQISGTTADISTTLSSNQPLTYRKQQCYQPLQQTWLPPLLDPVSVLLVLPPLSMQSMINVVGLFLVRSKAKQYLVSVPPVHLFQAPCLCQHPLEVSFLSCSLKSCPLANLNPCACLHVLLKPPLLKPGTNCIKKPTNSDLTLGPVPLKVVSDTVIWQTF